MSHSAEVAHDHIARVAGRGLDLVAFWQECTPAISRVVPHFQSPCWFTMDPASLLITSHYQTELPELPPEWMVHEYLEDDFHSMAGVARSTEGTSTLFDATGGDPSRSWAWREVIRPMGGDQELLVALRDRSNAAWGILGLYREPDRPPFSPEEIRFLRRVAPHLGAGAQRALLIGEAADPEGPEAPGLVILDEDWDIESLTPGTQRWLDELPDVGRWTNNPLPPAVLAVAGRALGSSTRDGAAAEMAFSRVLSRSGRWLVLHGAAMVGSSAKRVAVIIEPAHPARIYPLLMAAYQLTEREQQVTRLVLHGNSTSQIAEALNVSPHTVQQHLKTIFDKTGVRSRRDLVGRVFFAHYEPRLRDNEQRVMAGSAVRGGPAAGKLTA